MIGSRLKELRIEAGMTQLAFAGIVKTTKQYVSQLERGKNLMPNGDFIDGWARHFKVSHRWIVSGSGSKIHVAQENQQSQPLRLDQEIVESSQQALAEMYKAKGWAYHGEDVARFVLLYEKFASRKAGVSDAELFGAGLTDFTAKGAAIERLDGVPNESNDKRAMARRLRYKA